MSPKFRSANLPPVPIPRQQQSLEADNSSSCLGNGQQQIPPSGPRLARTASAAVHTMAGGKRRSLTAAIPAEISVVPIRENIQQNNGTEKRNEMDRPPAEIGQINAKITKQLANITNTPATTENAQNAVINHCGPTINGSGDDLNNKNNVDEITNNIGTTNGAKLKTASSPGPTIICATTTANSPTNAALTPPPPPSTIGWHKNNKDIYLGDGEII